MPRSIKKNHRPKKNQIGSYRIIGGEWRSRRLNFPVVEGLRPTTDRVRETLFNWLSPILPGALVLDLFSGSGSLGVEALSRGAANLLAIEKDKAVAQGLKDNLASLGAAERSEVVVADAIQWAKGSDLENVDILFLDPPFRTALLDEALAALNQKPLKEGSLVYLELEKEKQGLALPSTWKLQKEKQAGQVSYRLYQVATETA